VEAGLARISVGVQSLAGAASGAALQLRSILTALARAAGDAAEARRLVRKNLIVCGSFFRFCVS